MSETSLTLLSKQFSLDSSYKIDRETCSEIRENLKSPYYKAIEYVNSGSKIFTLTILVKIVVKFVFSKAFGCFSLYALLFFGFIWYASDKPAKITPLLIKVISDVKKTAPKKSTARIKEQNIHTIKQLTSIHQKDFDTLQETYNSLWGIQKLFLGNLGYTKPSNSQGKGYRLGRE